MGYSLSGKIREETVGWEALGARGEVLGAIDCRHAATLGSLDVIRKTKPIRSHSESPWTAIHLTYDSSMTSLKVARAGSSSAEAFYDAET